MKQELKPKDRIKLDHLGQFYSAINCKENPGTFSLTAYLHEQIIPKTLQQAVNDLMQRLPFLNVRVRRGFFWYYNEILETELKIISVNNTLSPCSYFEKGDNHLIRVIYGEKYFTIEVLHSVCDGRRLSKILVSLLVRYFEILGEKINKDGIIDFTGQLQKEEIEDAYFRYAKSDIKPKNIKRENNKVYIPIHRLSTTKVIVQKFSLSEIKPKAKAYGITITEYILANIFCEFSKQRVKDGCSKPITANIPIDCRGFFPTECLRNFVSHKVINMPEILDFAEMAKKLKDQFTEITSELIQGYIGEMENQMRFGRFFPLFLKNWFIKKVGKTEGSGNSTGFSNLGLIKLPDEIKGRIDMFSFTLGSEPNMPYQFASVAVGDILTLTSTVSAEDISIIEKINSLKCEIT